MFPLPSLYIKLAGAALVAAAVAWHWFGDVRVRHALEQAQAEVVNLEQRNKLIEEALLAATQSRAELESQVAGAEQKRLQVQAELATTLTKLRKQKPPVECKAAVDWAIENKGDLAW